MHFELAGHDRERRALFVPRRGKGNGLVVHLADHSPSRDAGPVEVVDDGGPMNLVPTGETVDRRTLSVELDQRACGARRLGWIGDSAPTGAP